MKWFARLHLWLALPFGVIISLICFSGAMLVFEPEVTRLVCRDVYYVRSAEGSPLPVDSLCKIVEATLPDTVAITDVEISDDRARTYQMKLSRPRRASVFIDQYTGCISGKYRRLEFFSTMFRLHRWLLDGANARKGELNIGKIIVGVSTIAFVLVLISGAVIWIPRARKNFRRSISIGFRHGRRGFWRDLHVAGGMYVLVFVMAMSLTGLTWSFPWYRSAFYKVCGVENVGRGDHAPDRLRPVIYAVHTGSWGGTPTRIIWFVSALAGASLPVTGYYIWISGRSRRKKSRL